MTDTTQPSPAHTEAHRLDAGLERAFDLIDLPVGIIDADGVFVWMNGAVLDLLGARVGGSFLDVLPAELHDVASVRFARKLRGAAPTTHRLELVDRNGRRIQVLVRSSVLNRDGAAAVVAMAIPMDALQLCGRGGSQPLTPRQEQVLGLLAEGLDTEQIAQRMGIALETARNHIRGLLTRLEVHSRLGAVLEGLRRGVLDLDELDG